MGIFLILYYVLLFYISKHVSSFFAFTVHMSTFQENTGKFSTNFLILFLWAWEMKVASGDLEHLHLGIPRTLVKGRVNIAYIHHHLSTRGKYSPSMESGQGGSPGYPAWCMARALRHQAQSLASTHHWGTDLSFCYYAQRPMAFFMWARTLPSIWICGLKKET
jgi:hypothetical protein